MQIFHSRSPSSCSSIYSYNILFIHISQSLNELGFISFILYLVQLLSESLLSWLLLAYTIWDALIVSSADSLTTGAAIWVHFILAVLTVWAAPWAVPRVSAMRAVLAIRAVPRVSCASWKSYLSFVSCSYYYHRCVQRCSSMGSVSVLRIIWSHGCSVSRMSLSIENMELLHVL